MTARTPPALSAVRILQLSDLHLLSDPDGIHRGVCTQASFEATLRHALDRYPNPDLLLLTGDLAQDEARATYLRLRDYLAKLSFPVALLPGNHDRPGIMASVFAAPGFTCGGSTVVAQWRLALLDSHVNGQVIGDLDDTAWAALEAALNRDDHQFVLVCLHHPPVAIGSRWLDRLGLRDGDRLLARLRRDPRVRAVAWGHAHQAFDAANGPLRLLGCPATCRQFLPGSDEFALDPQPPGYRHFLLHPDGSLETGLDYLPDWPAGTLA